MRQTALALLAVLTTTSLHAGVAGIRHMPEPVPGLYLIMLRGVEPPNVPPIAKQLVGRTGGTVRVTFQHASTGFSARLTEAQALAIAIDPHVDFVEEVAVVRTSSIQPLPADNSLYQLDRIDQATNAFDHQYNYCEQAGSVYAYMIGSGVYRDHVEFQRPDGSSRVVRGAKFASDDCYAPNENVDYGYWPCGVGTSDSHFTGHDTACASALGGKTYGVAKAVTIVPIRIIAATGLSQTEWMNWAIDWIMNPSANPYYAQRPAVVSISTFQFTQGTSSPDPRPMAASYLENEINKLVGHPYDPQIGACRLPQFGEWSGVPVVVSANNQNTDQSYTTPARMAFSNTTFATCGHVISVGGIDETDQRWVCNPANEVCAHYSTWNANDVVTPPTGSNYGATVDIYAPAHNLLIAGVQSSTAVETQYAERSGTSFAAPLVAGVIARLQQFVGALSCDDAWTQIQQSASHAPSAIDYTGNDRIVHRDGAVVCYPEYP